MTISTIDESRCKATRLMRFTYLSVEISIDKKYATDPFYPRIYVEQDKQDFKQQV